MEFAKHFPTHNRPDRFETYDFTEYSKYHGVLKRVARNAEDIMSEHSLDKVRIIALYPPDERVTMDRWVTTNQAMCEAARAGRSDVAAMLAPPPPADGGDRHNSNRGAMPDYLLADGWMPDYHIAERMARQRAHVKYQLRMARAAADKANRERRWTEIPVVLGMTSITVLAVGATMVTVGVGVFVVPYLVTTQAWVMVCSNLTSLFHVRCFVAIFRGFGLFTDGESLRLVDKFIGATTQLAGLEDAKRVQLVQDVFARKSDDYLKGMYPGAEPVLKFFEFIRDIVYAKEIKTMKKFENFPSYVNDLWDSGYMRLAITALSIGQRAYTTVQMSLETFRKDPDADSMLIYKRLCLDLSASLAADSVFHEASRLLSATGTEWLDRIMATGGMTNLGLFLRDPSVQDELVMFVKHPIKDYATRSIRGFFAAWEPKKPEPAVTTERMMANVEEDILRRRKYRREGLSDEDIERLLEPPIDDKSPDRYKLLPIRRLKHFARKFRAYSKSPATLVSALSAVFTLNTFIGKIIGGGLMTLIVDWRLQWTLLRTVPGAMLELVPSGLFHHKLYGLFPSLAEIATFLIHMFVGTDEVIDYKLNEKKRALVFNLIVDLNRLLGEIYGELASMIRDKARGTRLQQYVARLNDCVLVRVFTLVCNFVHAVYEAVGVPFLVYHATKMTPVIDLKLGALIMDKERMVQLAEYVSLTAHNAIKQFQSFEWGAMLASVKHCFDYARAIHRVVTFIDANGYIQTTPVDETLVGTVVTLPDERGPPNEPGPVDAQYIITAFDPNAASVEVVRLDPNRPLFDRPTGGSDLLHYYVNQFLGEKPNDTPSIGAFKEYLLKRRSNSESRTYLDVLINQLLQEVHGMNDECLMDLMLRVQSATANDPIEGKTVQAMALLQDSSKRVGEFAAERGRTKRIVSVSELITRNPKMDIPSLRYNHFTGLFDYRVVEVEALEYFNIQLLASVSATDHQMSDVEFWTSVGDASQQASALSSLYATTKAELKGFVDNLEHVITDIKQLLTATDGNQLSRLNYLGFDHVRFRVITNGLKVGVGDNVQDSDGKTCVIRKINYEDPGNTYQVEYPNGDLLWTAASGLRHTGLFPTLTNAQRADWFDALNVDVYEKIDDPTTKIFANKNEFGFSGGKPVDMLTGVPVDGRAYRLVKTPTTESEMDRLLCTPEAISALALSSVPELQTTREALSDFTRNHLASSVLQTIEEQLSQAKGQHSSAETQALATFASVLSSMKKSRYLSDSLHDSLLAFLQPSHLKPTPTITSFYDDLVKEMESDKKFGDDLERKTAEDLDEFWSKQGFKGGRLVGKLREGGQYHTAQSIQSKYFKNHESEDIFAEYSGLGTSLQNLVDAAKKTDTDQTLENRREAVADFLARRGRWFELNRTVYRLFRAKLTFNELDRSVRNLNNHYLETGTVLDTFKERVTAWRQSQATRNSATTDPPIHTPKEDDATDDTSAPEGEGRVQPTGQDPPHGAQPPPPPPPSDMKEAMQDTAQRAKEALSERTQEKMEQAQEQKSTLDESEALESSQEQALQQQLALSSAFATAFSNLIDGFARLFNTATPKVRPMVPTAPVPSNAPDITEETSEQYCRQIRDDWFMGKRVVKTLQGVAQHEAARCAHRSLMDQFMGPGMDFLIGWMLRVAIPAAQGIVAALATIGAGAGPLGAVLGVLNKILSALKMLVPCMPHFFAFIAYEYIETLSRKEVHGPDILKAFFGVYIVHALPSLQPKGWTDVGCDFAFKKFGCSMEDISAAGFKLVREMKPKYDGKDPNEYNIHGYVNEGYQPTMLEMLVMLTAQEPDPLAGDKEDTLKRIVEKARSGNPLDCDDYRKLDAKMFLRLMVRIPQMANVWDYINCGVFGRRNPLGGFHNWGEIYGAIRNVRMCVSLFSGTLTNGLPFLSRVIAEVMENPNLREYLLDEILGQPSAKGTSNVNVGRDLFDQYFDDPHRGDLAPAVLQSLRHFVEMIMTLFIKNVLSKIYHALGPPWGDMMISYLETALPGYPWHLAKDTVTPGPSTAPVPPVIQTYRNDPNVFNHPNEDVANGFIRDLFKDIQKMSLPFENETHSAIVDNIALSGVVDYTRAKDALNATRDLLLNADDVDGNFQREYGTILRNYISRLLAVDAYRRNIKQELEAHALLNVKLAFDSKDEQTWKWFQPCETTDIRVVSDEKVRCIPMQTHTGHVNDDAGHQKRFEDAFRMDGPSQCASIEDLADSLVRSGFFIWFLQIMVAKEDSFTKSEFCKLLSDFGVKEDDAVGGPIHRCVNALTEDTVVSKRLSVAIDAKNSALSVATEAFVRAQLVIAANDHEYAAYLYSRLYKVGDFKESLRLYDAFDSLNLSESNGNESNGDPFKEAHYRDEREQVLAVLKTPTVARAIRARLVATLKRWEQRRFVVRLPDKLFEEDQSFHVQMDDRSFDLRKPTVRLDYVKAKNPNRTYNENTVDLTKLTNKNGYFLYADHKFGVSVGRIAPLNDWLWGRAHKTDDKYSPKKTTPPPERPDEPPAEAPPPLLYIPIPCPKNDKCNPLCMHENDCQVDATFDFIRTMYTRHESRDGKSVLYVLKPDEAYLDALLVQVKKWNCQEELKDYTAENLWDDVHAIIRTIPGDGLVFDRLKKAAKTATTMFGWDSGYPIKKLVKSFEKVPNLPDRIGFSMSDTRVIGMAFNDTSGDIFTRIDDHILDEELGIVQVFNATNV